MKTTRVLRKFFTLLSVILIVGISNSVFAQYDEITVDNISRARSGEILVSLSFLLPACHKVQYSSYPEGNIIRVDIDAVNTAKKGERCMAMMVESKETISLGILAYGDYEVAFYISYGEGRRFDSQYAFNVDTNRQGRIEYEEVPERRPEQTFSPGLPNSPSPIQHVPSGKCWHPEGGSSQPSNGTYVVLHEGCYEDRLMFRFLADGSIQHVTSGKCLHPEGGSAHPDNNTRLVFNNGCVSDPGGGERLQFRRLNDGSIQHVTSGKCVHPYGGSANPDNNTRLVLHDGCVSDPGGGERLQFGTLVP